MFHLRTRNDPSNVVRYKMHPARWGFGGGGKSAIDIVKILSPTVPITIGMVWKAFFYNFTH